MSRLKFNDSIHFLTSSTFGRQKIFDSEEKKRFLLRRMEKAKSHFGLEIFSYSLMTDHYHWVFYLLRGCDRQKVTQFVNGGSSYLVNKIDKRQRRVWDKYWASYIDNEEAFYNVIGYVAGNPIKHGLVKNFNELEAYPFCNYRQLVKQYGRRFAEGLVRRVIDLDFEV